jgi:hypothetical protein
MRNHEGPQPYWQRLDDVRIDAFSLLTRLDNPDETPKPHRRSARPAYFHGDDDHSRGVDRYMRTGFFEDDAAFRLFNWNIPPPLTAAEVEVKVSGIPM